MRRPSPFHRALRDPWSLVVAGVGAGAAWAIGLPTPAAGLVGAGMFGVTTIVGIVHGRTDALEPAEPAPIPLRAGTVQANLVNTVHDYRVSLELLQRSGPAQAVAVTAAQAIEAARTAELVANRLARSLDAIDVALTRADTVARQMVASTPVQESVQRMKQQRRDLVNRLAEAVDEIGEVYAKLLELSTTTDLLGTRANGISEARQVSESLDVIREVFADLEALDLSARPRGPGHRA